MITARYINRLRPNEVIQQAKMKLVVFLLALTAVFAELPAYNSRFAQVSYQVPYPISNNYQAGRLVLARPQVPRAVYGPPTPEPTTTEAEATTTEQPATTTEAEAERIKAGDNSDEKEKLTAADIFTEQGAYYIYHPNGLLQRVVFSTADDVTNMAYTAQLKYQNVEPIREPVYTYDPETFSLRQIQF